MSKFFKNPDRGKPENVKSYVPQWKIHGREPIPAPTNTLLPETKLAKMPYAESSFSTFPSIANLPLIGNNADWASLDSSSFNEEGDSVTVEDEHQMIDNNDFVYQELTPSKNSLSQISINEYVLMVDDTVISTGSLEDIQLEVKALIFEEHYLSKKMKISQENILVFKRIPIKVGVFLE